MHHHKPKVVILIVLIITLSSCFSDKLKGTYQGEFRSMGPSADTTVGSVTITPKTADLVTISLNSSPFGNVSISDVQVIDQTYNGFEVAEIYTSGNPLITAIWASTGQLGLNYIDTTLNRDYEFTGQLSN